MAFVFAALASTHDRAEFDCGQPSLNDFLVRYASQYQRRNVARVYVAVEAPRPTVLGFYALSSHAIPFANVPPELSQRLPHHPVPVVLLGRLAVDRSAQGKGLGAALLRDALVRCLSVADQVGVFAVLVEAIDDTAASFYEHFGFTRLADQPGRLYIPISTLRRTV